MKALIVYESMYGNTRTIAEVVADDTRAGLKVAVRQACALTPEDEAEAGLVIAGVPTHLHGMPRPITRKAAAKAAGADGTLCLEPAARGPGVREWLRTSPGVPASSRRCSTRASPAGPGRTSPAGCAGPGSLWRLRRPASWSTAGTGWWRGRRSPRGRGPGLAVGFAGGRQDRPVTARISPARGGSAVSWSGYQVPLRAAAGLGWAGRWRSMGWRRSAALPDVDRGCAINRDRRPRRGSARRAARPAA